MNDPREPVYLRLPNGRYKAFASIDDFGRFDPWCCDGLFLHTSDDHSKRQYLIARLDDLPCPAISYASVMRDQDELAKLITEWRQNLISNRELATKVLDWVATKSNQTTTP